MPHQTKEEGEYAERFQPTMKAQKLSEEKKQDCIGEASKLRVLLTNPEAG